MYGNGMGPHCETVIGSNAAWASAIAANHRRKKFRKKRLQQYKLFGQLFNANTVTGLLQISSTQPTLNNSKERELDAAFLSSRVHVNVDADNVDDVKELPTPGEGLSRRQPEKWAAEPVRSIMANSDSDHEDSDVELKIATAYVQICIEYVQKYYMKHPMCTSILSGKSYVKEVVEGNSQVCYDMFCMDVHIFKHLCNELKRLHLLEEDTGIVLVKESVSTLLYIVEHNIDFWLTSNHFQHSLKTIQRQFWGVLRAIHSLGCLIIRPDIDAAELAHSLHGNNKYYPWFKFTYVHAGWEGSVNDSRVM
ncbi:hypothetical protein SO802_012865 [Lithocarpus litseifolius]|uniref:DUF8040 domain-containing protein n=1 Tax=Lithocarpus litseifolius TaxID=425828 RepID=A0AAW2D6N8_9ROSI